MNKVSLFLGIQIQDYQIKKINEIEKKKGEKVLALQENGNTQLHHSKWQKRNTFKTRKD